MIDTFVLYPYKGCWMKFLLKECKIKIKWNYHRGKSITKSFISLFLCRFIEYGCCSRMVPFYRCHSTIALLSGVGQVPGSFLFIPPLLSFSLSVYLPCLLLPHSSNRGACSPWRCSQIETKVTEARWRSAYSHRRSL